MSFQVTASEAAFLLLELQENPNPELAEIAGRMWEQLGYERKLSSAQQDLLREHYGYRNGLPGPEREMVGCMDPQRCGVSCGKCLRCVSITTGGALKWKESWQS